MSIKKIENDFLLLIMKFWFSDVLISSNLQLKSHIQTWLNPDLVFSTDADCRAYLQLSSKVMEPLKH